MELIHRKVPHEFLEKLPAGMALVQRQDKDFLVVTEVCCSRGHSLMCESVRIHNTPSIRIRLRRAHGLATVYVDAYWGSHAKLFDFLPEPGEAFKQADAHCPECGVSLMTSWHCGVRDCDSSRAIEFHLPGRGNLIQVCARLGCPDHRIVIDGVASSLAREISEINYFGYGEEEEFRGI